MPIMINPIYFDIFHEYQKTFLANLHENFVFFPQNKTSSLEIT